jgi:outer membrane receptor protein involved in Fe transport
MYSSIQKKQKNKIALPVPNIIIFFIAILYSGAAWAQGNNLIYISGKIADKETGKPLSGVSIQIKGTIAGTISSDSGTFTIRTKNKFPLTLVFSSVGFAPQEFDVKGIDSKLYIALETQTALGQEVVVTASRISEARLKSPVAIEKLDIRAIRETASPNFYDALQNIKGVQMTTSSLTFKIPNTRGFNIPNNFRFVQMVDGVDMQSATLGVPLGNAIGPTELDIASVEITPGAASALYGMNAINGMANLITKSPFTYQGLSIYQNTGINHVGDPDESLSLLTESAIRYAKAFNNKFAFKVNFGYLQGTDWRSNNQTDQNPNNLKSANPLYPALDGPSNNTAYDGWNKYGDDALAGSNLISLSGLNIDGKPNQTLRIARTGYWENDLNNPHVKNLKFDGQLNWRIAENAELSYGYRYGQMDGTFQRGNKIRLDGVTVQNHHLQLQGSNYTISAYMSIEHTNNSYNIKPLADNIDLHTGGASDTKTPSSWGTKYKNALLLFAAENGGALTSANLAAANQFARAQADAGRAQPGTAAFNALMDTIININNWDIKSGTTPDAPSTGGAALWQNSRYYNFDGQWDLSQYTKSFNLLIGGNARIYNVIPDGNNFVDFSRPIIERNKELPNGTFGSLVVYKNFGGFFQITKTLLDEKLKLWGSLRIDYNPYFKAIWTPRFAAVYTLKQKHNFRLTFQQGYRFPALFEALSFVNNGRVRRVGSLPFINDGLGYLQNSYSQQSVINFNAAVSAQGNTDAAALANQNLLTVANLPDASPEKITSFEFGYKSILLDNTLVVDLDAYVNQYKGFLGQVQVYVPNGVEVGTDAGVIAMLDRNRDPTAASGGNSTSLGQSRYRVYTNSIATYYNWGTALAITFNFYKRYTLNGNVNFNNMKSSAPNDIFVTGFNTPQWNTTLSFGNPQVVKNTGFNITWRWQDSFLWQSPLVNGTLPAFSTLDAQLNYRFQKQHTTIKLGGTDLLNHRYLQFAGGPTLSAIYYIAITVDGLLQ